MKPKQTRERRLPVMPLALLLLCQASLAEQSPPELLPSAELLLFLAEFDDTDDETFAMILERGKRDINSETQQNDSDTANHEHTAKRGSENEQVN